MYRTAPLQSSNATPTSLSTYLHGTKSFPPTLVLDPYGFSLHPIERLTGQCLEPMVLDLSHSLIGMKPCLHLYENQIQPLAADFLVFAPHLPLPRLGSSHVGKRTTPDRRQETEGKSSLFKRGRKAISGRRVEPGEALQKRLKTEAKPRERPTPYFCSPNPPFSAPSCEF